ncbi:hypothetical protein HDU79_007403 [Rhizoclosmatium sp. JEL0117]|nr:hypothetical protein HDU79_007403 [Rhizoclosmatium sp. JEL0117]
MATHGYHNGNSNKTITPNPSMNESDSNELQRLKATKWLPPLSDSAPGVTAVPTNSKRVSMRTDKATLGKTKDDLLERLMVRNALPNIPLNKGRFPASELKKCHEIRTHLKNNPNRRFIIGLRERALEIDEKNAKRAIELQKAQEQNGNYSWDLIRPLSRDPVFGKYIQMLNTCGQLSVIHYLVDYVIKIHCRDLGYSYESTNIAVINRATTSSATTDSPRSPKKSSTSRVSRKDVKSNSHGIKCSVGDVDLDKLIQDIEISVFRAKRKGDCAIRGNDLNEKEEFVYSYGKPSVLSNGQGDEYGESFKQLTQFGSEVTESIAGLQKDKFNFSNISHPKSKGRNININNERRPPSIDNDAGFSKPPTAPEQRKDPSKQRRQDFLKWQADGQVELKNALKARVQDRLEASKDKARLAKVLDIIEHDIKVDFYLHSTNDPKHWMSVLPHIWVPNSDELMKELDNPILKQLNRRNANGGAPAVTAASIFKERAFVTALMNTHAKATALAGHQRRESIIASSRRMDEYQKMVEGKDIVVERSITAELFSESHLEALFGKKAVVAPGRKASVTAYCSTAPRQNSMRQTSVRQMSIRQSE